MNEKLRKTAFPHEGKQEISEKRPSLTGKTKKQRKTTFPHGGKSKISEKRLSLTGGNRKNSES